MKSFCRASYTIYYSIYIFFVKYLLIFLFKFNKDAIGYDAFSLALVFVGTKDKRIVELFNVSMRDRSRKLLEHVHVVKYHHACDDADHDQSCDFHAFILSTSSSILGTTTRKTRLRDGEINL